MEAPKDSTAPAPGQTIRHDVGMRLGERYTLHRFLGSGSTGAAYEALTNDSQRVALKIFVQSQQGLTDSRQFETRFFRQAKLTANLDSPYLVPITDAAVDANTGLAYIVTPLLAGMDLEQLLMKTGPLHPTVVARIAWQIAQGLKEAHAQEVIHRDIKPDNIFMDHRTDGSVMARVMDFSLGLSAQSDGQSLTATSAEIGTPRYQAPEQLRDPRRATASSDLWSLGLVLHAMLTGDPPFRELESFGELSEAVYDGNVDEVQAQSPWVDPSLAQIVHGMLLHDVPKRCPSIEAFIEAIEPFTGNETLVTRTMLEPVPHAVTKDHAPPAELPPTWTAPKPTHPVVPIERYSTDTLLGQRLGEKYHILRELGRGGMGAVYEATDAEKERYAIKVIRPDVAGNKRSSLKRFVREARTMMTIESEHVVKVIDADTDPMEGLPFIVMELMRGGDLDELMKQHGALDHRGIARLFIQACHGIAAAHAQNIIHRDIKPANLFLNEEPSGEIKLKICDFGIAKFVGDLDGQSSTNDLTQTGGVLGSPEYMSPEQTKSAKDIDHRSDIWSLGIVLYKALCGQTPWQGKSTVGEIIVSICTEPLPHLQDRAPWIPKDLAEVVHKALSRSFEHRFETMNELAAALEPFALDRVYIQDLRAVTSKRKSRVSERASMPEGPGSTVTSITEPSKSRPDSSAKDERATPNESSEQPAPKSGTSPWLIVAVVASVVGSLIGWGASRDAGTGKPPHTAEQQSEKTSQEAVLSVRLGISPKGAQVIVDGKPRPVIDGAITMTGRPGDHATVSVAHGSRKMTRMVVITRSGTLSPAAIALAGNAATPAADAQQAPSGNPRDTGGPDESAAGNKPSDPVAKKGSKKQGRLKPTKVNAPPRSAPSPPVSEKPAKVTPPTKPPSRPAKPTAPKAMDEWQ